MSFIWVIIPLVVFSISGISESFGDEVNSDLSQFYQKEFQSYHLKFGGDIDYTITEENEIIEIERDFALDLLEFTLRAPSEGVLSISFLHGLLGHGYSQNCYQDEFEIMVNGKEISDYDQWFTEQYRRLSIPFSTNDSEIVIQLSEESKNSSAYEECTKEVSLKDFEERGFEIYNYNDGQFDFFIPYQMNNGTINEMDFDILHYTDTTPEGDITTIQSKNGKIILEADSTGFLRIVIPRHLADLTYQDCGDEDIRFYLDENFSKTIGYQDIASNYYSRTLQIEYQQGITELFLYTPSTIPSVAPTFGCPYHDVNSFYYSVISPKKQFDSGISQDDIKCNEGFGLIFKTINNHPACVKSESVDKITQRGWGICPEQSLHRGHPCRAHFSGVLSFDSYTEVSIITIPKGSASPENQLSPIPKEITVVLGINNTVIWVNEDDVKHSFWSDKDSTESWWTGVIMQGTDMYRIFNQTGVFEYQGKPQSWLTGKVIVLEEENQEGLLDLVEDDFSLKYPSELEFTDDFPVSKFMGNSRDIFGLNYLKNSNSTTYPNFIEDKESKIFTNAGIGKSTGEENWELRRIVVDKVSITGTQWLERQNNDCNSVGTDYGCMILKKDSKDITVNGDKVTITKFVTTHGAWGGHVWQTINVLIDLHKEQETWVIYSNYNFFERNSSNEIVRDVMFSNLVNSLQLYEYQYNWNLDLKDTNYVNFDYDLNDGNWFLGTGGGYSMYYAYDIDDFTIHFWLNEKKVEEYDKSYLAKVIVHDKKRDFRSSMELDYYTLYPIKYDSNLEPYIEKIKNTLFWMNPYTSISGEGMVGTKSIDSDTWGNTEEGLTMYVTQISENMTRPIGHSSERQILLNWGDSNQMIIQDKLPLPIEGVIDEQSFSLKYHDANRKYPYIGDSYNPMTYPFLD